MTEDCLNIFKAILKIGHYTGFSKEEIQNWSLDEITKALTFIDEQEKINHTYQLAYHDYYFYLNRANQYDKKNQDKAKKDIRTAEKIRNNLTGKKEKRNNFSIFEKIYNKKYIID